MADRRVAFDGFIGGAAFASGDVVVLGRWLRSPFGPFADVMWARPGGERILLAPRADIAAFVRMHYSFDEVRIAPVVLSVDGDRLHAVVDTLELTLERRSRRALGWALRSRPRAARASPRWIELEDRFVRPIVGPLLGASATVRTTGTTNAGVREWYAVHDAWPARARLRTEGRAAGPVIARPARGGFGFSEFLTQPAIVRVTSLFDLDLEASGG